MTIDPIIVLTVALFFTTIISLIGWWQCNESWYEHSKNMNDRWHDTCKKQLLEFEKAMRK